MKVIIEYQCEICGKRHNTEEQATSCESLGRFDVSSYPIGLMYEYHHNGYVGIFCIAEVRASTSGWRKGHIGEFHNWAIRVPEYPYGGFDQKCGHGYLYSQEDKVKEWAANHNISNSKVNSKEFNDMVKGLQDRGLTPKYYNESGTLITIN